jgi:3-deoxy-7-phosphoheptulonate synthase
VNTTWHPNSWTAHPAGQQPEWPELGALDEALHELGTRPPLVFAGEARRLTEQLARVANGQAIVLQAGKKK